MKIDQDIKIEKSLEMIAEETQRCEEIYTRTSIAEILALMSGLALGSYSSLLLPLTVVMGASTFAYIESLLKMEYRDRYGEAKDIMQSREYLKLQKMYKNVLVEVRDLMTRMDVHQSIDICAVYGYLLENGYLSENRKFLYSSYTQHAKYIEGSTVSTGEGSPIDVQVFFRDLLQENGIESHILLLKNKNWLDMFFKEASDIQNMEINAFAKFCAVFARKMGIRPDWSVTFVKDSEVSYMVDFLYDCFFGVGKNKKVYMLEDERKEFISNDFASFSYPRKYNGMKRTSMKPFLDDPKVGEASLIHSYMEMKEKCPTYQDVFETFYREHQEQYEELACKNREYSQKIKML